MTMIFKMLAAMAVFATVMTQGVEVRAMETPDAVVRNLLDLSNLVVSDDSAYLGKTVTPVTVDKGSVHTLVLDYGFIGQHAGYVDRLELVVRPHEGHAMGIPFVDDPANARIHASFTVDAVPVMIEGIPALPETSYDAMLYEGTYEVFSGFIPFARDTHDHMTLTFDPDDAPSVAALEQMVEANLPDGTVLEYVTDDGTFGTRGDQAGVYHMRFEAFHAGATAALDLDIVIKDDTAPVIEADVEIFRTASKELTIDDFLEVLSVSDDVDSMDDGDIRIVQNGLEDSTGPGTYTVIFEAVDASGNVGTFTLFVELEEDDGPQISGPPDIFVYVSDDPLTPDDIMMRYDAYDVSDATDTVITILSDGYVGTRTPGVYRVTLSSSDSSGNVSLKHINIHVIMDATPTLSLDLSIIETTVSEPLSASDLIRIVTGRFALMGHDIRDVSVRTNGYIDHSDEPGHYVVTLDYILDGQVMTADLIVLVSSAETPVPMIGMAVAVVAVIGAALVIWTRRRKAG
jgi:hypothetical protein